MTGAVPRLGLAAAVAAALLGAGAVPAAAAGSLITVIDNSHADSWLEVDRAGNVENGSGTAGSDHDGSAVDVVEALAEASGRSAPAEAPARPERARTPVRSEPPQPPVRSAPAQAPDGAEVSQAPVRSEED
ncbi:hypothetical protein ACF073_06390 [Streptomyces sp. NPDC015171]|uniref:hypothetical protein n=1 Tax=Streptomyces sp. NPDC015171 TaxID=3364945 RepID=UPI0036FC55EA